MVKPELAAPAGSVVVDTLMRHPREDPTTSVIGAGGVEQNRLLADGAGTSYAAPLVSHTALRVLGRYPQLTANAARALVLLSCEAVADFVVSPGKSKSREQQRRLTGYGRVAAARAELSADHRAVLVSDTAIGIDEVHLYRVPMPSTLFTSGGWSRISFALAYDPPVRVTRLDYLASRMGVAVYHGANVVDIERAYAASNQTGSQQDADETPPALGSFKLDLQPSDRDRGRGANQFGTFERRQRFDANRGTELIVAVRNVNRWDTVGATQSYALAIALERDPARPQLFVELQTQLETLAHVEIEQQVEL